MPTCWHFGAHGAPYHDTTGVKSCLLLNNILPYVLYICVVLISYIHVTMHCSNTTTMDGGSADIAGANICPYILYICITLLPSIRPTWQGLFLQSYCISSIHGGQMWEVWKMQGAIFNHGHMHLMFRLIPTQ